MYVAYSNQDRGRNTGDPDKKRSPDKRKRGTPKTTGTEYCTEESEAGRAQVILAWNIFTFSLFVFHLKYKDIFIFQEKEPGRHKEETS